jgi:hypothetical protein
MDRGHNCYFGKVRSILSHFELALINLDFTLLVTAAGSTQVKTHLSCSSTLVSLERFAASLPATSCH